jgi:hypothetical protein
MKTVPKYMTAVVVKDIMVSCLAAAVSVCRFWVDS